MATIQLATCNTRSGGVSLAVRGCGLNRFLPPIILSVCVYVDMSVYCPFKFQDAHSHTRTHMHTAKTDTACSSHSQPWLQAQMWRTFFFFFFLVLLCFIHVRFLFSFLVSTRWWNAGVLFCPATHWDFTHCREVLWWKKTKKGDLNKHKLNQGFVPNCYMFSIWHLSKLLYMWGTFIVRDCLCVWAIIFNVCHSQRDGTVLHMLCNQAHSWSWIVKIQ